jgi:hypothetical protein
MSSDNYINISLPSKCVPYDGVNQDDIKIRPYKGKDELFLSEITANNLDQKYLLVLEKVLKGIDPKKLTLGDRLYVIIWEYINSYNDTLDVEFVCGNCFSSSVTAVSLRNLDVIELPADYKNPTKVDLPSGKSIFMRLLTIADEIEIQKYEHRTGDSSLLFRLAKAWVNDSDVIGRTKELEKFDVRDTREMRRFFSKYAHGPNMISTVKCPRCGEENVIDIPFRFELIFPEY